MSQCLEQHKISMVFGIYRSLAVKSDEEKTDFYKTFLQKKGCSILIANWVKLITAEKATFPYKLVYASLTHCVCRHTWQAPSWQHRCGGPSAGPAPLLHRPGWAPHQGEPLTHTLRDQLAGSSLGCSQLPLHTHTIFCWLLSYAAH